MGTWHAVLPIALSFVAGCSLLRSSDDFFVVEDASEIDADFDARTDARMDAGFDATDSGPDMPDMPECTAAGDCPSIANGVADCVDGRCVIGRCIEPAEDCNGSVDDGCEVELQTEADCMACGDTCGPDEFCGSMDGMNACGTDCGDETLCEDTCADLMTDAQNCASCGNACPTPDGTAAAICAASACDFVCDAGREDCDDVPNDLDADGCETDIAGDVNNCGGCGTVCASSGANIVGLACVSSLCAVGECSAGFGDCNGVLADGCETPTNVDDVNNCGGCGIVCDPGAPCESDTCIDVYVDVAVKTDDVCARRASGIVECWGRNVSSELNESGPAPVERPTPLRWTPPGASEETLLLARQVVVSGRQVPSQPRGGGGTLCFISDHTGSEGQVFCAGDNNSNVAGRSASVPAWPPFPIELDPSPTFVELAMGAVHACGRTVDGEAYCWGSASFGATGTVGERLPVEVPFADEVEQLALTVGASCARLANGEVHCIGRNNNAELGRGSVDSDVNATPEPVISVAGDAESTLTDVVDLVSGEFEYCARQSTGRLVCWGRNFDRSFVDAGVRVPTPVEVASDVVEVWMPVNTVCWRTSSGDSFCRGRRVEGQFGDGPGSASSARAPVATPVLDRFDGVVGGAQIACGFDGLSLHCWGYSPDGEIPRPSLVQVPPAPLVDVSGATPTNLVDVDLGDYGGCARAGTTAYCWGLNRFGPMASQLLRSTVDPDEPLDGAFLDVSIGDHFACGIVDAMPNELRCWGRVFGTSVNFNALDQPTFLNPAQVDVGTSFACTREEGTGEIFCGGINDDGQCGVAPSELEDEAREVLDGSGDLSGSLHVSTGDRFACALRGDGRVTCWGAHDTGQLGRAVDGGFVVTAEAGTVGDVASATQLATGDAHACAIDGGDVKCWGAGGEGQLGTGSDDDTFTPAAVRSPGAAAATVATGGDSTCAAYVNNEVYCWGNNDFGQLGREGDGSNVPVLVEGVASQQVVSGPNSNGYCARLASGAWTCWGSTRFGRLGTEASLVFEPTLIEPSEL